MQKITLAIAGIDPGGGAGIAADLKTFHQLRVYGTAVVTMVTVQNTVRFSRIRTMEADLVGDQLDAVLEDFPPAAVKTGALGNAAVIAAIAARHFSAPLVVDPVIVSKHGGLLMDDEALAALKSLLLPRAALVTPNLGEAAELAGIPVEHKDDMWEAARRIAQLGVPSVLVKGGHLAGSPVDLLFHGGVFTEFGGERFATRHTHGTGCTYSAAITAFLARGYRMEDAVEKAKRFISEAIRTAPGLGSGSGPVNHRARTRDE